MKNRYRVRIFPSFYALSLSIGYLAIIPAYAAASPDYFDLSLEQLAGAKVVSVSKKEEKISEAPAAVYVVTQEDIARSGVTTIPEALRMVPGVQVARADSNSWAVSIRGFNSVLANKLLVLIDGRTIYNPLFGGVMWEAHDLMLEDIDRIEVVRGPGGTLWGANAVNGVINIITKRAGATQGNLISGLYGNEEEGTLNVRHGGSFGEDRFYRVYTKGFNRDSSRRPGGGETYDAWDGFRSGFRADWADNFTLQGDIYRTRTDQLRTDFSLAAPFAPVARQDLVYDGANILGRWTDRRDDGSQLSIQSYIDWARRDEPVNFIDERIIFDVETQYNLAQQGRHEIIAGAGYRYAADHEETEGNRNVTFIPEDRHDSLYSAFIQDKITLVPDTWFLTLGSKFEHNEYSGFEVQPNVRLQWNMDERQMLWASVARAVRTPTPIEQDVTSTLATGPAVRLALVGNKNFGSEELTAYELGYRNQITPEILGNIALFYNDYDRLTTLSAIDALIVNNGIDPIHLLIPIEFRNDMRGQAYGFEVDGTWSVNSSLKLIANYSLLQLSVDAEDNSTFFQEGLEDTYPAHQAGLRTSWNISEGWTLDTGIYYVDRLKSSGVNDYVRFDVNLGWQIDDNVRFNLVGQNLLDPSHREFGAANDLNAAEIERSVFGKLTWEF